MAQQHVFLNLLPMRPSFHPFCNRHILDVGCIFFHIDTYVGEHISNTSYLLEVLV